MTEPRTHRSIQRIYIKIKFSSKGIIVILLIIILHILLHIYDNEARNAWMKKYDKDMTMRQETPGGKAMIKI